MTREDIHAFCAVAKHRNFTRAAEELFLPQPSLSKRIARLEQDIGVQLFSRTRRSVRLTYAGQVFLDECQELLSHEEEFLADVRHAGEQMHPALSVGFMGMGLARKCLPAIHAFRTKNPEVALSLSILEFRQMAAMLSGGRIDLAITGDWGLSADKDIQTSSIFPAARLLLLPEAHPWLRCRERDFSALADEDFIILYEKASRKGYENLSAICASWGFQPRIRKRCASIDEVLFHVQAGQGISILPDFDCPPAEAYHLAYVPIEDGGPSIPTIGAWVAKNKNPVIQRFLACIHDLLQA